MKMDVEGAEFDVLSSLMESAEMSGSGSLPFGQLLIELHITNEDQTPRTVHDLIDWWQRMESLGLRPVHNEHNLIGDVIIAEGHPMFIEVRRMSTFRKRLLIL